MMNKGGNYFFIHIPRTGGTTIEQQLHLRHRGWQAFPGDTLKTYPTQHYHIEQIFQFKQFYMWKQFVFTIVRNPWDRLVSEYGVKQMNGESCSFNELMDLTEWRVELFNRGIHYDRGVHKNISHSVPQYAFVYYGSIQIPNFIGRFEEYEKSLSYISEQIGYSLQTAEKLHATKHDHYSKYYSRKNKGRLAKLYKWDIQLFNYRFKKER